MVNVAGRSRGCYLCRKRRCGQEKPECAQCIKLSRACPGYDSDRIFIHTRIGPAKDKQPKTKTVVPAADQSSAVALTGSLNLDSSSFDSLRKYQHREQLLNDFMVLYKPKIRNLADYDSSWILLYPHNVQRSEAFEVSFSALCAAVVGNKRGDKWLVNQSLSGYTRGLRELQKALWDPKIMHSDETLAAAESLALYEIVECPNRGTQGFMSHFNGLARLVKLRGPAAHRNPLGRRVFCTFRLLEVLDALEDHTVTFLDDERWIHMPWEGVSKPVHEKVIDIFVRVATLLNKGDDLATIPLSDHGQVVFQLTSDYWALEAQLEIIEREIWKDPEKTLYWPMLSKMDSPADDAIHGKVFPVTFFFEDFSTANALLFYWTASMMVRAGLAGCTNYLHSRLPELGCAASELFDQLPKLGDRESWITPARNACQCIEYCFQEPMAGYSQLSVVPCLSILSGYLQVDVRYDRELQWVDSVLGHIADRGMRVLHFSTNRVGVRKEREQARMMEDVTE